MMQPARHAGARVWRRRAQLLRAQHTTNTITTDASTSLRVGVVGLGAIGTTFFTQLGRVVQQERRIGSKLICSIDAFVKPHHIAQLKESNRISLCETNSQDELVPFSSIDLQEDGEGRLIAGDNIRIQSLDDDTSRANDEGDEPIDVVLVALKAYDSARAIEELQSEHAGRFKRDAVFVLLQNGLGALPAIQSDGRTTNANDDDTCYQYVHGVTYIGARMASPGNVIVRGLTKSATYFAPTEFTMSTSQSEKILNQRLLQLGAALSEAGLMWQVLPHREMQTVLWRKLIVNAAINPIASVLNTPNGNVGACEWSRRCVASVVREAVAIAVREQVDLQCTEQEMVDDVLRVAVDTRSNVCSMVADLRRGARTEIDAITGQLLQHGARHGIPTPSNALLYDLIKTLEVQRLREGR